MWIMTENGSIINTSLAENIYWATSYYSEKTGNIEYNLVAHIGLNHYFILENVNTDCDTRDGIMLRLMLAIQQGGLFNARDLYEIYKRG